MADMRKSPAPVLALWWMLSRLVVLILLFGPESRAVGDVGYFAKSLDSVGRVGLGATMPEYPIPALLVVAVPWVLVAAMHMLSLYGFFFVGATLCVDALFTVALHRSGRDGAGRVRGGVLAGRGASHGWSHLRAVRRRARHSRGTRGPAVLDATEVGCVPGGCGHEHQALADPPNARADLRLAAQIGCGDPGGRGRSSSPLR